MLYALSLYQVQICEVKQIARVTNLAKTLFLPIFSFYALVRGGSATGKKNILVDQPLCYLLDTVLRSWDLPLFPLVSPPGALTTKKYYILL